MASQVTPSGSSPTLRITTFTAVHEGHGFATRVPEGVDPFSSPVVPIGEAWEYTFE